MYPIRSDRRQQGVTLMELMLVVGLSLIIVLAAGALFNSVDRSYKLGAQKVVGSHEASHLATVISRRARVASEFLVYDVGDPTIEVDQGNGLALLDTDGAIMYRFEWDALNATLADSTGVRVTSMSLQNLQFRVDPVTLSTLHFSYQTVDAMGDMVTIQSAATRRNSG